MSRQLDSDNFFPIFTEKESYVWEDIKLDYETNVKEIQNYIREKETECAVPPPPAVEYLSREIFPLIRQALIKMFGRVSEDRSFYNPQSVLNGIDFISEYIYNANPLHPERKLTRKNIFDMDWVHSYLEQNPRPFYPLRLIWSGDKAARVIQAYYRGYLVRKRKDVQELRTFWKRYNKRVTDNREENVKTLEEQKQDPPDRKNRNVTYQDK